MGAGPGFAVAAEEHLIAANRNKNHADGSGLREKLSSEGVNTLPVEERCRKLRL